MFAEWSVVFGLMIGATIGSFLNMVIYRLPRGLSFSEPKRSFCPNCKHALSGLDLIPIFSWLRTGGRCRHCGQPIAVRYLVVELVNAVLFGGIWWQYFVATWAPITAIFYMITAASLVAVIFIDWELYIIPDELNAFILVVGLVYRAVDVRWGNGQWMPGIMGALLGWGLLWGIALLGRLLFGKDAMGHGDIKLMRGVGLILGPLLLPASLGMAVIVGLVVGLTLIGLSSRQQPAVAMAEPEEIVAPESIGSLLIHGIWYLLCMDVFALFFPGMNAWIGDTQSEVYDADEDWKPSLTTIPFGPYLTAGALVCMLFGNVVENVIGDYWRHATGDVAKVSRLDTRLGGSSLASVGRSRVSHAVAVVVPLVGKSRQIVGGVAPELIQTADHLGRDLG